MHIKPHFTTAYCPWSNGAAEYVCGELFRAAHLLLSKRKVSVKQFPAILNVIQVVISHSPVERLATKKAGNIRCPREVFPGLKPFPPIAIRKPLRWYRDSINLVGKKCRQVINTKKTYDSLKRRLKEIVASNHKLQTFAKIFLNTKISNLPFSFDVKTWSVRDDTHARKKVSHAKSKKVGKDRGGIVRIRFCICCERHC